MNNIREKEYQLVPLPWDIESEIKVGNYDTARKMIAYRLATPHVPSTIKKRLEIELEMLDHDELMFIIDEKKALKMVQKVIKDFTAEDLQDLVIRGRIDYEYINGKRMYHREFLDALFRTRPDFVHKTDKYVAAKKADDKKALEAFDDPFKVLSDVSENAKEGDILKAHIHMDHILHLDPKKDVLGQKTRIHMPLPWKDNPWISNLKINSITPDPMHISRPASTHHTAYFETTAKKQDFRLEYEYDFTQEVVDLYNADPYEYDFEAPDDIIEQYTREEWPAIAFTPFMQLLAEEIVGDETNPLLKARLIYDYITNTCTYRFVRDYASVPNISEYNAINGKGDCGFNAILFITLCRIVGVPAKWESGHYPRPNAISNHDWCMIYVEGLGWRHVDPSVGNIMKIHGLEKSRQFYFGNVDPYRCPCNTGICEEFDPPKNYSRYDPTDSQDGEVEFETRGSYLFQDFTYERNNLGIRLIK